MGDRGKGKKCADCANWKVKDGPCSYQEDIRKGIIRIHDPACEDFYPKGKEKIKLHKASGYGDQGFYEAIYANGKPFFLAVKDGTFHTCEEVAVEDEVYIPKEYPNEFPYEPYGYFEGNLPTNEELYWKIRAEFGLFLDLEPIWKDYLSACVLLSYQQEKTRTVPYVYFVGDNESGKTVALNLLNWLCYRPMLGVTIPSADVYGYLDDSDDPGTILEDEAQGLYKDLDKAKIYKAGYKKGAVVPRTMITQNKRFIKYFRVFCFKACAAEEMPRVKGLLERFIFISMTEGYPRKDWADLNKDDETRLRELRNILLKWRLATKEVELPEIELPVKGRLKELWKPIIQVIAGLTVEKGLRAQLEQIQKDRLGEKINTLEGHLVKVVCELYRPQTPLASSNIWDGLVKELEGKLDDKKPNKMDTADFGEITKQKIGYRLREVLSSKKTKARLQEGPTWVYSFDQEKLKRIAKKYGCQLVPKFQTFQSTQDNTIPEPQLKAEEKGAVPENKTVLEAQKSEQITTTPAKVEQPRNSGTFSLEDLALRAKSIYRLTMDFGIETCICCGAKGRPDWQVTSFDDSWSLLCGSCGVKLSERLGNQ
jgi:hypothetical protein